MTEDEAKTKWCPFARTPNYMGTIPGSTNRNIKGDGLNTSHCIGSACMAWRWTRPNWTPTPLPIPADGRMRWYDASGNETAPPPSDVDGYCGLAGKP